MALDKHGAPDFAALQAALSDHKTDELIFFAFDLLFIAGRDLRELPLRDRKAQLKALRVESTRVLDLERFVDASTIDCIYWDEPYYLSPSEKTGVEAFAVILEAMREKDRIGIGRLVLNTRERSCALEPRDNRILLTTLRTHEDIVAASDAGGTAQLRKPDRRMLEIAEKIIEQQVCPRHRVAMEMDNAEHDDRVPLDSVEHSARKLLHDGPTYFAVEHLLRERLLGNAVQRRLGDSAARSLCREEPSHRFHEFTNETEGFFSVNS